MGTRSNRGFWIVAGAFGVAAAVVIVGTIVSQPEPPSDDAGTNLGVAVRAARIVEREQGGLAEADAGELLVVEVTLDFLPADEPSAGPTEISVLPGDDHWVGAALAGDGATCHRVEITPEGVRRWTATGTCAARA